MTQFLNIKKLYTAVWILLTLTAFATFLTGNFNHLTLLLFSLGALALVHALALWTVINNTRETTG